MKRILVLNGFSYAEAVRGLCDATYDDKEFVKHPESFDMVLFTGGADISPHLYGETSPKGMCYANPARDEHELAVFNIARENDIPMAGICRGVQFLSVMAGGRLMHHLNGHGGGTHQMLTRVGRRNMDINSLHHQMVIPHEGAQTIGVSTRKLSNEYVGVSDSVIEYSGAEVEAAIFPGIKSFGVQYHPEMMHHNSDGYIFFYLMVKNALSMEWDKFVTAYTEGIADVELFEVHDTHRSISR